MTHRRDFLKTLTRLGLAGGLVGGGAHLALRKPAVNPADHICIGQGLCRGCKAFSGCGLPQALSAKAVQKRMEGQA